MASTLPAAAKWTVGVLGVFSAAHYCFGTWSFLYMHFLRRGTLDRYKTNDAWALVTGASDGVGRAFAEELCRRGFNVVLHGRNEDKLSRLKQNLQKRYPDRAFRILLLDAAKDINDSSAFERAAAELGNVNLKVLINNVGGSSDLVPFIPLHECPPQHIQTIIDVNARFPIEITRALLPQLRTNTPALILNIGSISSEFPIPHLGMYSGSKAANKAWSRSLLAEQVAEGVDIEVLCLMLAVVATDNNSKSTSVFVPTAQEMVRNCLRKVGVGRSTVFGYWAHEIQASIFFALPEWLRIRFSVARGKQERIWEEAQWRRRI